MAQIALIPQQKNKTKKSPSIEKLTHAAWQFAHAILWQEQQFYPKEIERTTLEITEYFRLSTDPQKAFIAFCERVVLTNNYLSGEQSRYLPQPSIWFNKNFPHGYTGTLPWYHKMQYMRQQVPNYKEGINTLAHYYWQYTIRPSKKTFAACRKKLLQLKEYGLIRLFYNSIIYSQFLNPVNHTN
jgi:hypothetical protein